MFLIDFMLNEGIEIKIRIFAQEILDTTNIDSYGAPQQQTKMVEHQIDAFAGRLAAAAEANSVRDLLKTQFRLIPENAALLANDTRAALGIFVGAGAEVRSLIKDTADELRGRKPAAAKATAKAPAAPRKKTAKKKPAKKAPVAPKAIVESEVEAPKAA